jgi:hypothetical protein
MFHHGPCDWLEIDCDAPAYPIVQACRRIGVRNPEDVRWRRMNLDRPGGWQEFFRLRSWKKWLGGSGPENPRCSCGQDLPEPIRCTFTYVDGREEDYVIGQCRRCRTVFWDEPQVNHEQH